MTPAGHIDQLTANLTDWRGKTFATMRRCILEADAHITEEWKYMGSPVWYRDGMIAVGNAQKTPQQEHPPQHNPRNASDGATSPPEAATGSSRTPRVPAASRRRTPSRTSPPAPCVASKNNPERN